MDLVGTHPDPHSAGDKDHTAQHDREGKRRSELCGQKEP